MVLCVIVLSVIPPVNLTVVHAGKGTVLVAFDVCRASSPFQPSNAGRPFYPEQISSGLDAPEFTGFYTASQPLSKPLLLPSNKEKPPRA
ncbi:MAG: hypothetical protein M0Z58_08030 [Nitrospiraceae bacterium]|nr:hypothetical protein [Nitrospiraceae bacterium]